MIECVSESTVTLINAAASDQMVAAAAWVSNNLDDETRLDNPDRVEGLINFLLREKHMSPFEHGLFTFKVETPIFVCRELVRHRTMSFNEMSGRYTQLPPRFYVPNHDRPLIQQGKIGQYTFVPGELQQLAEVRAALVKGSQEAYDRYIVLKSAGVANEVARMVLPVNIMTQIYVSVDPRNLMHFLNLRLAENALYEIREVAGGMEKHFESIMPMTYAAWKYYATH